MLISSMSPQKNAWQIHSDHQQIQIISIVKSKEDCLKPRVLLQKNRDRRPAAQARLARRTQKPTCFAHLLTCSFSNRKNRRKDGGIYSLSILQAEASGIHDGRWFGGGRCRCCQDARHRLQGRFGTCVSISVSCCHSTKILPPHAPNPWWSSGDNSVFLGNQDAFGPQTV